MLNENRPGVIAPFGFRRKHGSGSGPAPSPQPPAEDVWLWDNGDNLLWDNGSEILTND